MIQACEGWQSKGHLVGSVFFIILKNPIRKKKWSWKHIVKAPSMEFIDFCYLFLISVVCSHIICSHLYSHHACEHVSRPPGLGLVQPSTCAGCKRSLCCPVVQEDSVTQNLELLSTSTHIETTIIRYNLFEMTIFVATLAAYISSHHTREWKLKSWTAKSFFFCRPILEWFYWSHAVQRVDISSFAEFERGRFDCFLGEALTPLDHQFPCFPAIEWSRFFLGGGQICSWKSRCLCETNKHPGWIVYWVSSGRVNICVLISTFIVDERDKDGGRTCWQVIWLSGSFPGALVWSSFIPALLLFWPVCIAIATARESLFLLHSAGNPLLVGRCRGSYLHLIFTPIRAGKWTEMFCESEKLDRTCGAGHDLGGGVWRGDRKSETKWTRGGNSLWLSRGRPCCCKPALNRLN